MDVFERGVATDRASFGNGGRISWVVAQAGEIEGLGEVERGSRLSHQRGFGQLHTSRPGILLGLLEQKLRFLERNSLKEAELCFVGVSVAHR